MRSPFDPALIANLHHHVDRLAGLIGPRHPGNPRTFAAAAELIERELRSAGYTVEWQTYIASGQEVANLIAELPGGTRKHEVVILGAHYDTIPPTPGADDNASGVAVMIEAARLMRRLQPARTIRFVAFACEEMPYFHTGQMGSQVYARQCRIRRERIQGMLGLEIVSYYTDRAGSQRVVSSIPRVLHRAFPKRGDFLAAVGNLRPSRLSWALSGPCGFRYSPSCCPSRFAKSGSQTTARSGTRAIPR